MSAFNRRALLSLALSLAFVAPAGAMTANALGTCPSYSLSDMIGKVCWRCVLPLTLGAIPIANIGGQVDIENPVSPYCVCPGYPPRYGLTFGFWEPSILAEVVRTPYCMPSLGGQILSANLTTPRHGRRLPTQLGNTNEVFYQAHHYIFPLFWIMGMSTDNPCLLQVPWDIGYMTEVDASWHKPELSSIFNADAGLFASPRGDRRLRGRLRRRDLQRRHRSAVLVRGLPGQPVPANGLGLGITTAWSIRPC